MTCCGGIAESADKEKTRNMVHGKVVRKRPPKQTQSLILTKQGNACGYCRHEFGSYYMRTKRMVRGMYCTQSSQMQKLRVYWDHFVPYAYLQSNPTNNWVAACQVCNGIKGSKTFETFEEVNAYVNKRIEDKKITFISEKVPEMRDRVFYETDDETLLLRKLS